MADAIFEYLAFCHYRPRHYRPLFGGDGNDKLGMVMTKLYTIAILFT